MVTHRGKNVFIVSKMVLRKWLLIRDKRWLIRRGSKCTRFIAVVIGHKLFGHYRGQSLLREFVNRSFNVFHPFLKGSLPPRNDIL